MRFIIIPILSLLAWAILAQTPAVRHFGVEDGLPSSNIYKAFEDNKGYIWFCTDKGITRFDGYTFELFDMEGISASSDIWGINEDQEGRLWFSTFNDLVYFENNTFHSYPISIARPNNMVQRHFFDDRNNHFIEFVNSLGIYQVNETDSLEFNFIKFPVRDIRHNIYFLKQDEEGHLWFSCHYKNILEIYFKKGETLSLVKTIEQKEGGFLHRSPINMEDATFAFLSKDKVFYFDFETLESESLTSLLKEENIAILPKPCIDGQHICLWTNKGLRVVDKNWKKQTGYDFLNAFSEHRILEDSKKNIWIYTQNDGVYMLPNMAKGSVHLTFSENNLDNAINAMVMDKHQQLWMGTISGKIIVLDKNNKIRHFKIQVEDESSYSYKLNSSIMGLSFDKKGNLYLGYEKGALVVIPESLLNQELIHIKKWTKVKHAEKEVFFSPNEVYAINNLAAVKSIKNNDDNQIMLSTSSGIYSFFDKDEAIDFERVTKKRTYAAAIFQEKLWGGNKQGIFQYKSNNANKKYIEEASIFQDPINDLAVSQDKKLWIATDGNGLFRYDGTHIDTIIELQGKREIIKSLFIDKENALWVATNKGIVNIKTISEAPFQYQFRRICKAYGLATEEVNQVYVNDTLIYAATLKGLTVLEKTSINRKSEASPLYFTNISVNHIKKSLQFQYTFPYDQNNLLIEYLCLSYESLGDIPYQYWMEGIDKNWQSTTAIQKEYSALTPGNYVFRLRAKDFDGNWSPEKRIKITITPPWWKSSAAYLSYLLLFVLGGYGFFNYQFKKHLKKQEIQRNKEMSELKSRFYTNITHEFRTPLTIILGFTKRLKESLASQQHTETLDVMQRHGTRLLHLINQLLDLNKIEAGSMPISWQHADIISYINYLVGLFESAASDKNIGLTFYKEIDSLYMDFDADKIQTIFYNLLSNAIKFTPSGGEIIVHVAESKTNEQLMIKVKDNGIGIRSEVLAFIFQRFYQDRQNNHQSKGTGIGLALAKELVEQMNGFIEVESNQGGTMFTIQLPIKKTAKITDELLKKKNLKEEIAAFFPQKESSFMTALDTTNDDELPLLLIVEDNVDLNNYLQTLLRDTYQIVVAKDGVEGIEKAFELTPDLIVSDIMMPNKSGLELCAILKEDERTSHIPIVLLTGKSSPQTKLTGLAYGADAYLVKPFEEKELLIRLKKLNELRQKLQQRYANFALSPTLQVTEPTEVETTKEDVFLQKVRTIVEENIDNADLDVNKLCQLLVMSRSQLHKKITALTGKSTTHFIRNIRLRKAQELLKNTNHSIAEIAFQTGFEAQYFSTVFSRTFGMSPTAFRKQ